jgi:hypothetical protein
MIWKAKLKQRLLSLENLKQQKCSLNIPTKKQRVFEKSAFVEKFKGIGGKILNLFPNNKSEKFQLFQLKLFLFLKII